MSAETLNPLYILNVLTGPFALLSNEERRNLSSSFPMIRSTDVYYSRSERLIVVSREIYLDWLGNLNLGDCSKAFTFIDGFVIIEDSDWEITRIFNAIENF